jgi:hypothetical protein
VGKEERFCRKPFQSAWTAFAREERRSSPLLKKPTIGLEAHSNWSTGLPVGSLAYSVRFVSIVVKSQKKGGVIVA